MFHKDTFRLIKKTRKRFITILLIVLIGVGFMVGLMSSAPTMRVSVDKYYDETDFMDLQLYSSYGFDDRDVTALKKHRAVKQVFGTKFVDAFYQSDDGAIVCRVQEINCDMNKITLTKGRMPSAPDEALALGSSSFGSVFKIGDVAKLYLEDDTLSEKLAVAEYKIVGIVKTPQYMASSKETSTLNNLGLSTVIYTQNNNFIADYYTSIYLTFKNSRELTSFTSEYKAFVEESTDSLKKLIKEQEPVRRDEIIEEVKRQIAEGEKTLEEEIGKAQKEIDDGRKKLEDANIQLLVARAQITASEEQIKSGEIEIAVNEKLLADGEAKLNDGKKQLEAQLGMSFEEGAEYITTAYKAFNFISSIIESELSSSSVKVSQAVASRKEKIAVLKAENKELADEKARLTAPVPTPRPTPRPTTEPSPLPSPAESPAAPKLDFNFDFSLKETPELSEEEKQKRIIEIDRKVAENNKEIRILETEIASLEGVKSIYGDKLLSEILEKINRLMSGGIEEGYKGVLQLQTAETEIKNGKRQLDAAKAELEAGKKRLVAAREQIVNGRAEYEKGTQELEEGQKQLNEEKEKAEIELAKARQQLDDLPQAGWTILNRDMHFSTYMFENNSAQMGKIGYVFPMLFFLVAALVCMTTMKRLVDEERSQIGIFSALGFSSGQIISKYVIYAFSASILGSIVAIPIGMAIFPVVIYFCWRLMYDLPDMVLTMPVYIMVLGICSFTLLMIAVTVAVAKGVLKENPSMLMRPKAPKTAKKVFLEKITFIWKRLSFTSKVTARNIIRYKSRFFMTVIGVAGCTSLLVLGFAIKDSVSQVVSIQYGDIITYDTTAVLEDSEYMDSILEKFKDDSLVEYAVPLLSYSSKTYAQSGEGTTQVYVIEEDKISDIFTLRQLQNKQPLKLKNGVIISEKFARLHDIKVDDIITIESFNGIRKEVAVAGICEMYANHYLFISRYDYEDIFGENVYFDTVALTTQDSRAVIRRWEKQEGIKTISDFTAMKATFSTMFDSLNIIIVVIILAAGSLALVVIMNLTEVNISERIREIATLKVLGFNNKEVYSYIFKEVFILSLIGIVAGLPLGRLELIFVMSIIDMEMVLFPTLVKPFSYFASFCITLIFTILVTLLMRKTLRNVQMVESLKSVE